MLKSLELTQMGLLSPTSLRNRESYRRIMNLERDFKVTFQTMDPYFISSVDVSYDGNYLLCGSYDGKLGVYKTPKDIKTSSYQTPLLQSRNVHKYGITSLQWYPTDNTMCTTCSMDGCLYVWDINNLRTPVGNFGFALDKSIKLTKHHMNPLEPNLIAAICNETETIIIVDLRSGSQVQRVRGSTTQAQQPPCPYTELRWNPGDKNLLTIGSYYGEMYQYDIRSPKYASIIFTRPFSTVPQTSSCLPGSTAPGRAHDGRVVSLRYNSSGHDLFSYGGNGEINRFNTHNGNLTSSFLITKPVINMYIQLEVHGAYPSIVFIPKNCTVSVVDMDINRGLPGSIDTFQCFSFVNQFVFDPNLLQGYSGGSFIGSLPFINRARVDRKKVANWVVTILHGINPWEMCNRHAIDRCARY